MKTLLAFCITLLGFSSVYSQSTKPAADTSKAYSVVQSKPLFQGDINQYLAKNIIYPKDAKTNNIQGTVYISFIIEKDGSISTVTVLRGVQGGRSLENEAIRVISGMPKWIPGQQNGHAVRVQYMIPIHFRLDDDAAPQSQQK